MNGVELAFEGLAVGARLQDVLDEGPRHRVEPRPVLGGEGHHLGGVTCLHRGHRLGGLHQGLGG